MLKWCRFPLFCASVLFFPIICISSIALFHFMFQWGRFLTFYVKLMMSCSISFSNGVALFYFMVQCVISPIYFMSVSFCSILCVSLVLFCSITCFSDVVLFY